MISINDKIQPESLYCWEGSKKNFFRYEITFFSNVIHIQPDYFKTIRKTVDVDPRKPGGAQCVLLFGDTAADTTGLKFDGRNTKRWGSYTLGLIELGNGTVRGLSDAPFSSHSRDKQ